MSSSGKIFLVFLILTSVIPGVAYAFDGWATPTAVAAVSSESGGDPGENLIDTSIATQWRTSDDTEQAWIRVDLGSSATVHGYRWYTGNTAADGDVCAFGNVKICTDGSCTSFNSGDGYNVGVQSAGWKEIRTGTSYSGRYLQFDADVFCSTNCNDFCNGANLQDLFEFQVNVTNLDVGDGSQSQEEGGPCRTFCDLELSQTTPLNPGGDPGDYAVWGVTLTNTSLTNQQGEAYVEEDLQNVFIYETNGSCGSPGRIYDVWRFAGESPDKLLVNYTFNDCAPTLNLCFNGTRESYTIPTYAADISQVNNTYDVYSNTFHYNRYNLTFREETTGGLYEFAEYVPAKTEFLCRGEYDGFVVPLTLGVGTNYVIQTKTPADMTTTLKNNSHVRTLATESGGFYDLYLLNETDGRATFWTQYIFQKQDLTANQYDQAKLEIQRAIGENMTTVHSARWPLANNILTAQLRNQTVYKFIVTSTDNYTIDLGSQTLTEVELTKSIVLKRAIIYEKPGVYEDVEIYWIQDYSAGQLGVVFQTDLDLPSFFNVSNASGTTYVHTYSASSDGSTTYGYNVDDVNDQYFLELTWTHPDYGVQRITTLTRLYNQSAPLNATAWDQPTPDEILGTGISTWKKIAVVVGTWFIMLIACRATNYGLGCILAMVFYAFMWWVTWVPHNEVPWFIIPLLLVQAALIKFFENRN